MCEWGVPSADTTTITFRRGAGSLHIAPRRGTMIPPLPLRWIYGLPRSASPPCQPLSIHLQYRSVLVIYYRELLSSTHRFQIPHNIPTRLPDSTRLPRPPRPAPLRWMADCHVPHKCTTTRRRACHATRLAAQCGYTTAIPTHASAHCHEVHAQAGEGRRSKLPRVDGGRYLGMVASC